MSGHSLRLRLLAGAGAWIAIALLTAGVVITTIFANSVEQDQREDLLASLDRLLSAASKEGVGEDFRAGLDDPRYETPAGGLYWQVVDLDTGVVGKTTGPEVIAQTLFRDRFIGVVRMGHPLSRGKITPSGYAKGGHISVSRRGLDKGQIDEVLKPFGLEREIVTVVSGFSAALALARASDLIASVPERHTGNLRAGMHSFPLPIPAPEITISLLWHPRLDADPAHRWLRNVVIDTCAATH